MAETELTELKQATAEASSIRIVIVIFLVTSTYVNDHNNGNDVTNHYNSKDENVMQCDAMLSQCYNDMDSNPIGCLCSPVLFVSSSFAKEV